jgi:hypothetical protein
MGLIVTTTTATITRPSAIADPYEAAAMTTVASGVAAHVSAPSGRDMSIGGDKEVIDAVGYLPAGTDIGHSDFVTDEATGEVFEVVWVYPRRGLGLDHVHCGLRAVEGAANG